MGPAEDYFMKALALSVNSTVINQLALLLINQPDEAKQKRAVQFARAQRDAAAQLGGVEYHAGLGVYQIGNSRDAELALRGDSRARNLGPDSNYLVAKILADQKRPDVAKQFLAAARQSGRHCRFSVKNAKSSKSSSANKTRAACPSHKKRSWQADPSSCHDLYPEATHGVFRPPVTSICIGRRRRPDQTD